MAFGLPILAHLCNLMEMDASFDPGALHALIMVPTRELCMQVYKHLDPIARGIGVRIVPIVGGISHQKQERLITKHPPAIIVATPGRLWELISDGHAHLNDFSKLKFLVLDEADRMVQQGHYQELTSIFDLVSNQAASKKSKASFQTFVFSATLTLPSEMKKRLRKGGGGSAGSASLEALMDAVPFQSDKPKIIDISTEKKLAEKVTESFVSCPEKDRDAYVYCILAAHPGRTLVFVNAISSVRRLTAILKLLGLPVKSLHAGMQQRARLKALDKFSSDSNAILIATDVAARGLDIKDVKCVIHYQIPASADTYVHRSGRTARAEEDGISIAFVTPKEHARFRALLYSVNGSSSEVDIPEFPVDLSLMGECRKRVDMAVKYDSFVRKESKTKADKSWKRTNAEQLGIILSDDSDDEEPIGRKTSLRKGVQESKHSTSVEDIKKAAKAKAELDILLAEPLQPTFSKSFFTGGAAAGVAVSKKLGSDTDTKTAVKAAREMAEQRGQTKRSSASKTQKTNKKQKLTRKQALDLAVRKHLERKSNRKHNRLVVPKAFGRNQGSTALEAMKNSM